MTDELMREVDADIKRERLHRLWMRYRVPVLSLLAVAVMATAGASIWRDYESKQAGIAMQQLDAGIALMKNNKPADAAAQFEALTNDAHGELSDMARLWLGRAHGQNGQQEKAVEIFADLAQHPAGSDLIWRDMACLRLMALKEASVPPSCSRVDASPLQAQRQEWHAAALWRQGKIQDARAILEKLANDTDTPKAQRDRAARMLSALPAGTT